jgi:metal-responsive CopG/Arc/MetJ family transcriptional regulator
MSKVTKIAISLPEEMLTAVERERAESGETRSRIFCRAVELLLRERKEREISERYIRAYHELPETQEEIDAARHSANAILSGEYGGRNWSRRREGARCCCCPAMRHIASVL